MSRTKSAMARPDEALDEAAEGMLKIGLIDRARFSQRTLRHIPDAERAIEISVPSADDIRAMREKADLSQAVFAGRLNLTAGYISQPERGVRTPKGPALVLLSLIRKRGIDAIS